MNEQKKEFNTELLDYQEFTALVSALREIRILKYQARYRGDKSAMTVYSTRIKDICARVERDFDDRDHCFTRWFDKQPIPVKLTTTGEAVQIDLKGMNDLIYVFLILNRRKSNGNTCCSSDVACFYRLCGQAGCMVPKGIF